MSKIKLKPGDTVSVIDEPGTAKIQAILAAMNGALLETHIAGARVWNLDELRLVKRGDVKRSDVSDETREKLRSHWRKSVKRKPK